MTGERAPLVWRLGDGLALRTPHAVVERCGRCSQPVLVDRVADPDPAGESLTLVCVPCALADPETREQALRIHAAVRRLASVLPSAYDRRRAGTTRA